MLDELPARNTPLWRSEFPGYWSLHPSCNIIYPPSCLVFKPPPYCHSGYFYEHVNQSFSWFLDLHDQLRLAPSPLLFSMTAPQALSLPTTAPPQKAYVPVLNLVSIISVLPALTYHTFNLHLALDSAFELLRLLLYFTLFNPLLPSTFFPVY